MSEQRCSPRFDSGSERVNVRTTLYDSRFDSGSESVNVRTTLNDSRFDYESQIKE